MRPRGDSSLRIVSEEQAHALASAALDYGTEAGRPNRAEWLVARVSAILAAHVVLLTHAGGQWTIMTAAPGDHPFTSRDALDAFDDLTAGVAAVRTAGGQDWTLLTSGRDPGGVALAIAGDWTMSPAPFFHLVDVVTETSNRPGAETAAVVPPAVMRLHYRMLHRLARVNGLLAVSDTIIRHAAVAVDARLGAIAVTQAGDPGRPHCRDIRVPTRPGRTCTHRAGRRSDRHRHALAQTAVHDNRRSVAWRSSAAVSHQLVRRGANPRRSRSARRDLRDRPARGPVVRPPRRRGASVVRVRSGAGTRTRARP